MINITEIAAKKVKEVLADRNQEKAFLRLYVSGFGCGGPNFGMTLDESITEDDIVDQDFGVTMVTEKNIYSYLEGATVDYIESEYGSGFEIRTLQSGGNCGSSCGESCRH